MKNYLLLPLALLIINSTFAQGPIEIRNTLVGAKYYMLGEQISNKQVESFLMQEEESAILAKKAKTNLVIGGVVGLAGVVMSTVALFDDPFGDSSALFWSGVGVTLVSAPFTGIGLAKFNQALDVHNSKYLDYKNPTSQLLLTPTRSGFGLVYQF